MLLAAQTVLLAEQRLPVSGLFAGRLRPLRASPS
jgi:hypothetical protein